MQTEDISGLEKLITGLGHRQAIADGPVARGFAAPNHDGHAKGLAIACDQFADFAVAPNAQNSAFKHMSDPEIGRHGRGSEPRLLPGPVLERCDILGQATTGRHDQAPGELCRRNGRAAAFGHGHPTLGASFQVNVATDLAGLRNQAQFGQLFDQLTADRGAFADQYQGFRFFEPNRELTHTFDGVGVDLG